MKIGLAPDEISVAQRLLSKPLPPRRRVYGIGAGKTGNHALASLFTAVASAHEPETEPLIRVVLETVSGRMGWERLADLIRERDGRLSLVVRTHDIAARAHEIAIFAGLDTAETNLGGLEEFRNENKQRILQEIPREHLQEQVVRHCGPLMDRFVLTLRDPNRWLRSYRSMIERLPPATPEVIARRRILYGLPFPDVTDTMLLERRARHDAAVREWFRDRPESLLTADWEAGDGWQLLCGFLGEPVPAKPFPHENKGTPAGAAHPRLPAKTCS